MFKNFTIKSNGKESNLSINTTISPNDHMLTSDLDSYFRTSCSALEGILASLEIASKEASEIKSVLDFGSGYGRVFRALKAAFPNAICTACDLMEEAARFCAETFDGDWVTSSEDLSQVVFPRQYELVWLGSVFTHLPAYRWIALLNFLDQSTVSGGLVVFSAHGARSIWQLENNLLKRNPHAIDSQRYAEMKSSIDLIGFDFIPNKPAAINHQRSMGMQVSQGEYGFSFSTEWWVRQLIQRLPNWELVLYQPEGWGSNHDVVTLIRS